MTCQEGQFRIRKFFLEQRKRRKEQDDIAEPGETDSKDFHERLGKDQPAGMLRLWIAEPFADAIQIFPALRPDSRMKLSSESHELQSIDGLGNSQWAML